MPRNQQILRLQRGKGTLSDIASIPLTLLNKQYDTPPYPGEKHMTMLDGPKKGIVGNFIGPGTHIKERLHDKPINKLDAISKEHDINYLRAGEKFKKSKNKIEFVDEINKADKSFIEGTKTITDSPISAKIAGSLIKLKNVAETAGILPTEIFSGGAIDTTHPLYKEMLLKAYEPAYFLKKEAKGQKGGLAPLLVALIASLAPIAVEKLIDLGSYAAKKITGGSDPIKKAVTLLETMKPEKQHNLITKVIKLYGKESFL